MTPFDDTKPKPSDPGETKPAPNDPGDEIEIECLHADNLQMRREIIALQDQLSSYQAREAAIIDLIQRSRREDAYRRVHMRVTPYGSAPYPEGLGGAGQCDCTMGRSAYLREHEGLRALVEAALNKIMG